MGDPEEVELGKAWLLLDGHDNRHPWSSAVSRLTVVDRLRHTAGFGDGQYFERRNDLMMACRGC
jgi:hypothetical protein